MSLISFLFFSSFLRRRLRCGVAEAAPVRAELVLPGHGQFTDWQRDAPLRLLHLRYAKEGNNWFIIYLLIFSCITLHFFKLIGEILHRVSLGRQEKVFLVRLATGAGQQSQQSPHPEHPLPIHSYDVITFHRYKYNTGKS